VKNIPVVFIKENTLARAYENALHAIFQEGIKMPTQYDIPEYGESLEVTANITILDPMRDPMIHRAFPGGIEDLREYVFELLGYKDGWVKCMNDPKDKRWEYTYHQRLAEWGTWNELVVHTNENGEFKKAKIRPTFGERRLYINQIEAVVKKLIKEPTTRQAQMITWIPWMDTEVFDPPCLQSIWFRLVKDDEWYLNTNIRFRSNDAYKAFFMNAFGFIHFINEAIRKPVEEGLREKVNLGRINWQADSFHIYGKDINDFKTRFYNRIDSTKFEDRVYDFHSDMIQEIWKESEKEILNRIRRYNE
jgi:thymidylate synthase